MYQSLLHDQASRGVVKREVQLSDGLHKASKQHRHLLLKLSRLDPDHGGGPHASIHSSIPLSVDR